MRKSSVDVANRARNLRFERLVRSALLGLPFEIRRRLDNVDIVVEDEPGEDRLDGLGEPDGDVFGLYEGTPLIDRDSSYSMALPDKITIFRKPLQRAFSSPTELAAEIRITVLHELGHHFGFEEERLSELGLE